MSSIRDIRILVFHRGIYRSLCKIAFSNKDASIYLFPYSPNQKYFFGSRSMPDTVFQDEVDYKKGTLADSTPKVSIHESGQVHVLANKVLAGPLFTLPLSEWRGQHAASIAVATITSIPQHLDPLKSTGRSIDGVIEVADAVESMRLALYLAGDRPAFAVPDCPAVITLKRQSLRHPIYLALKPIGQDPIGTNSANGIVILAGWNPTNEREQGLDYLYIRGE